MAASPCRWGILGTANIARKNWKAIGNAENSILTAVASRDLARARHFIAECQAAAPQPSVPVACGSYEELLRRDDVDAVYLPLPTAVRKEWVLRSAAAGKHVLCEKPCGVTSGDVRAMLDACRASRVQFMDGVMFMHSRRLPLLRQALDDGASVGRVRRITSQFSFEAPDDFLRQNIRVQGHLEPLGCLGDLGWYNLRFVLWALGEQLPERVTGRLLAQHGVGPTSVPTEFSGELFYADGVSASFYCSFLTGHQQWANISGTRGYVHVSDFVLPYFGSESAFEAQNAVFHVAGCDFNMESHPRRFAVREYSNGTPDAQETNLVRTFAGIVLSGQLQPSWGEIALKTQQVLDACLRSARAEGKSMPVL
jgi:predicted dehydrogenase